jgi:hypothetical protein
MEGLINKDPSIDADEADITLTEVNDIEIETQVSLQVFAD